MKRFAGIFLILIAATLIIPAITGCKGNKVPTHRDLKMVMQDHFKREIYKDYVEVLNVEVLEGAEAEFMGGQYYDAEIKVRIKVKKAYVISKRYTATSFEVNEEWAERFEKELAASQTEEEREEVRTLFNNNTFSEGEHTITGILGFALLDGKWRLLTMMLGQKGPDKAS